MPILDGSGLPTVVWWFFAAASVMLGLQLALQAWRHFAWRQENRLRNARVEMLSHVRVPDTDGSVFASPVPTISPVPSTPAPSSAQAGRRSPARRLSFGGKLVGITALCAIAAGLTSLAKWRDTHAFMINATDSLPHWAFFVETGQFPQRGEYVVFHPGTEPVTVKYFGEKPAAFVKIAYGLPGDHVTRIGNDVLVNGTVVASLKPLTKRGDPLEAGPVGEVPEGCVFAATPHKDGFDSRYAHIGFVCRDRLVGIGQPIL